MPPAQRPGHEPEPEVEGVAGQDHRARPSSRRGPRRARGPRSSARPTAAAVQGAASGSPACRPTGRSGRPRRAPGRRPRRPPRPGRGRGPARPPRRGSRNGPRPCAAQRGKTSSPSGYDAVGRITTRGRGTAGRGEQAGIELGHAGEEFTGADERHGSGHAGESTRTLARTPRAAATLPGHDHSPTLDPGHDRHRLGGRLPRRDDRQRRAPEDRPRAARPRSSASSRARPTSSAATSPCWPRC